MTSEEATSLLLQVKQILVNSNSWLENTHEPLNIAFDMAIKALDQTRWIPVSERLPEKEMNCLVTDSLGKVHKVTFYHALDGRESYFSGCYCVKAWMPLPESYTAESEEV